MLCECHGPSTVDQLHWAQRLLCFRRMFWFSRLPDHSLIKAEKMRSAEINTGSEGASGVAICWNMAVLREVIQDGEGVCVCTISQNRLLCIRKCRQNPSSMCFAYFTSHESTFFLERGEKLFSFYFTVLGLLTF